MTDSGELLLFDNKNAYSHRESTDTWSNTGEVASVIASDIPIARTGTQQTMPEHATNSGVTVAAWEDSRGGVWCSVVEASTGRILLDGVQLNASGRTPRCVAVGTGLHVYFTVPSVHQIWVAVVNPASPESTPVPSILTEDLSSTTPTYDAVATAPAVFSGIAPAFISWTIAGGYRVGYVHSSGVLGSPVTGLPAVVTYDGTTDPNNECDGGIAVAFDRVGALNIGAPQFHAVLWSDPSGTVRARILTATNGTLTTTQYTGTISDAGTQYLRVSCEYAPRVAASSFPPLYWIGEDTTGNSRADLHLIETGGIYANGTVILAPSSRKLLGHALLSRAFLDGSDVYAAIAHPVEFFPYVAVVRISANSFGGNATMCPARLLPGLSTGAPARMHVTSVQAVNADTTGASTQHAIALGYRIQLSSENGDQFGETGIRLVSLDFSHQTAYGSTQLGRGLYLGGALLQHYDGRRWAEADFHCAPDTATGAPSIAQNGSVAGSMALGTYGYKLCYEEIDAQGELHPGAVSVQVNVTLSGGDNGVTLTIPTYRLTSKKMVRIGVFRSPVNQTGDPDSIPFYRVTSLDPSVVAGNNRYVANDPTVHTVTFIDGMVDATLLTKEPLYTNGGILSNDPCPSSGEIIAAGKGRIFWGDPSDPHLVHFSQQLRDDTAVEMSAALTMRTDPYGGALSAIAIMDGGVFAFKETAIYVADGIGPDPDGGKSNPNNAFTPWQLVTSDVGCKSLGSVVQTPNGIAFQSQKGIKLLGRDRQVVDIGRDVYAFNDQTITAATLLPDRHQVVFLTNSGTTLLWDYERGEWSKFTNHEGIDAAVVGGEYHYLRNDGRVFVETIGEYIDDNQHIPMVIETAWVKMAGYLQGWQKVLRASAIGTYKSSHQLQVRYRIDYQEAYNSLNPINVDSTHAPQDYGVGAYGTGVYDGTPGPTTVYQEEIHINRRCQAISFQFSDIEATGTFGPAFELSELLLVGGVLGPRFQVGAARSQ